eukprot:2780499-Pyramimonas_sp.AAC.1
MVSQRGLSKQACARALASSGLRARVSKLFECLCSRAVARTLCNRWGEVHARASSRMPKFSNILRFRNGFKTEACARALANA